MQAAGKGRILTEIKMNLVRDVLNKLPHPEIDEDFLVITGKRHPLVLIRRQLIGEKDHFILRQGNFWYV